MMMPTTAPHHLEGSYTLFFFMIFTSKMLQAKDFKTLVLLKLAKLEPQRIVLV
jgi:hypothetical protein